MPNQVVIAKQAKPKRAELFISMKLRNEKRLNAMKLHVFLIFTYCSFKPYIYCTSAF